MQLNKIFTVFDEAAGAHLPPFFMNRTEQATRAFADCINSEEHRFSKHPDHYTLFLHGSFLDTTAEFTLQAAPKSIGNGVEFLNQDQEPADENEISDATPLRHNAQGGDT